MSSIIFFFAQTAVEVVPYDLGRSAGRTDATHLEKTNSFHMFSLVASLGWTLKLPAQTIGCIMLYKTSRIAQTNKHKTLDHDRTFICLNKSKEHKSICLPAKSPWESWCRVVMSITWRPQEVFGWQSVRRRYCTFVSVCTQANVLLLSFQNIKTMFYLINVFLRLSTFSFVWKRFLANALLKNTA